MSLSYPAATQHGNIEKIFDDVFFVQGSVNMGPDITISRNMIIIRQQNELTLISAIRLNEDGLKQLSGLGEVKHVVRLGDYHLGHMNGIDDSFYLDTFKATLWLMPNMQAKHSTSNIEYLSSDNLPIKSSTLFVFHSSTMPEGLILINQHEGILIAADSMQNWQQVDEFFSLKASVMMEKAGFIKPANIGPEWRRVNQPSLQDFEQVLSLPFSHLLPSHGRPLLNSAKLAFSQTITTAYSTNKTR